jgi:carboxypeptidase D
MACLQWTLIVPTEYAVDGTALPQVDFDVGESYAGQLPVGGDSDGEMFFWFFPTTATGEPKEILIWLNGGPGCSSMAGVIQEHGPFLWPSGTYQPVPNPWSEFLARGPSLEMDKN